MLESLLPVSSANGFSSTCHDQISHGRQRCRVYVATHKSLKHCLHPQMKETGSGPKKSDKKIQTVPGWEAVLKPQSEHYLNHCMESVKPYMNVEKVFSIFKKLKVPLSFAA